MLINFPNYSFILLKDYNCILLKEILEDEDTKEISLDKDYNFFLDYIVNWEHTKKTFSLQIEQFESLFQEFGYYGANNQIKWLQNKTKEIIKGEYTDSKSIENYFIQRIEKDKLKPQSDDIVKKLCEQIVRNLDLDILFKNPNISENFIERFSDKIFKSEICENLNLSIDFLLANNREQYSCSEKAREYLTLHPKLNEDNIKQYEKCIVWNLLYINKNFSEKFLMDNSDKIEKMFMYPNNTGNLFYKRVCSEEFLEHFSNKLNWNYLINCDNLSKEFINKYKNKLCISFAIIHNTVDCKFLEENFKFGHYLYYKKEYHEFILNHKHDFKNYIKVLKTTELDLKFIDENIKVFKLDDVCLSDHVSVEFLEKNIDLLDIECWENISLNRKLPISFFEKYIHKLEWDNIHLNTGLPESFFVIHKEKLRWARIFQRNPNLLSIDFYKKHKKSINWSSLSSYHEFKDFKILELNINKLDWKHLSKKYPFTVEELVKYEHKIIISELVHNTFRYNHKIDYKNHYLSKYLN